MTGDESIIKAARGRWLRSELDGAAELVDSDAPMVRTRPRLRTSPGSTPGNSAHGGSEFKKETNGKNGNGNGNGNGNHGQSPKALV